jgi:hypothetical protein
MDLPDSTSTPPKSGLGAQADSNATRPLPYRWGYVQGALLIPFSLLIFLGAASERVSPKHEPWYLATVGLLIGCVGLPLGVGLLLRKRFALPLVYAMFGLSLLLVLVKIPFAVWHYSDPGDNGSAFFEAELLLVWLLSLIYYRKRREQFR